MLKLQLIDKNEEYQWMVEIEPLPNGKLVVVITSKSLNVITNGVIDPKDLYEWLFTRVQW